MDFQEDKTSRLLIHKCQVNGFAIGSQFYQGAIVIGPDQVVRPWLPQTLQHCKSEDFEDFAKLPIQALIIGTGSKHQFLSPALFQALYRARIGVEIMSTSSACHTFNILSSESRPCVTILMPLEF